MPKAIKIPKPISLKNPFNGMTEAAVSFQSYLELALFGHPNFDNPAGWRLTARLAATAAVSKDEWVLDTKDWEAIKEVDNNPGYVAVGADGNKTFVPGIKGFTPSGSRQLLPFSDAIQNAGDFEEQVVDLSKKNKKSQ